MAGAAISPVRKPLREINFLLPLRCWFLRLCHRDLRPMRAVVDKAEARLVREIRLEAAHWTGPFRAGDAHTRSYGGVPVPPQKPLPAGAGGDLAQRHHMQAAAEQQGWV